MPRAAGTNNREGPRPFPIVVVNRLRFVLANYGSATVGSGVMGVPSKAGNPRPSWPKLLSPQQ